MDDKPILALNAFDLSRAHALGDELEGRVRQRAKLFGPASVLFYDKPLEFVRGSGCWLYDAGGSAYLDAYNNVPSVGHCHPHVVEAATRQLGRLNVHNRYLHQETVDYAERLLATLPAGLSHITFTCTGSESNDLALRLASEFTGARGVIVTGCALDAMPKLDGLSGAVLRIAAALAPRLRISLRIDATALTQVVEAQQQHENDPLVPRTASMRLLYGFAAACRDIYGHAAQITLPWLAVHGEADRVCPVSGSRNLIGALGSPDKQLVTYPGLLHEVHNEDDASRTALFDLMTRWILERA